MVSTPKMKYQVFHCMHGQQSSVGKCKKQVWYYEKWVGRHASFPPRRSVKPFLISGATYDNFNAKAIDKDLNPTITYTATETKVSDDAEGLDTAPSDGWFSTTTGKCRVLSSL